MKSKYKYTLTFIALLFSPVVFVLFEVSGFNGRTECSWQSLGNCADYVHIFAIAGLISSFVLILLAILAIEENKYSFGNFLVILIPPVVVVAYSFILFPLFGVPVAIIFTVMYSVSFSVAEYERRTKKASSEEVARKERELSYAFNFLENFVKRQKKIFAVQLAGATLMMPESKNYRLTYLLNSSCENIDYIVSNKKIVEVSKTLLDDLVVACKEVDRVNKNSLYVSSNKYLKDVEIGFEKVYSHTKQLVELIDNQHDDGSVYRAFGEVKKLKQFTQSL